MISNTLPQSLIDNPILSQWIAFEEQGRVRVGTGKVEIGQGILTALTQIAAEELDVRPEQINLVSGQTDVSPAEGFTSGSYSIAVGGASIRLVCAEVRSLFLDRVAEALRLPGRRAFDRGRTNSCAPARTPAATTGRWRARSRSIAAPPAPRRSSGPRPTRSSASTCRGSTCRRRSRARASSTTSRPTDVLHARVLRQPWRGAHLVGARRERRAQGRQGADRDPARGRVRRLHRRQRACGDARRRGRPHAGALGRRHAAARRRRHAGLAQGAAVARQDRRHRHARPRAGQGRVVEALYSPPVPHLWLDRPVLRARRVQGRRAQGLVAHARARRCCATGSPARSDCPRRR